MTDPAGKAKRGRAIWYVLAAALAIRMLVPVLAAAVAADPVVDPPDTSAYKTLAEVLAGTGRFERGGRAEIIRTPGYPLLLVPGVMLGGVELVTIPLQIVLSCLTVYLVYRVALLLFGDGRAAVLCALLYALEPLSVVYASKLLTETLFTFAIMVFLYCLARYLKGGMLRDLLVSAAALAASVYVRPISYFLPALVAAGLLVRALRRRAEGGSGAAPLGRGRRRLLAHTAAFLALSTALLAPWQVRNAASTGYGGFSAIADVNLYFYQAASVRAAQRGRPFYEVQAEMGHRDEAAYFRSHPDQREWSRGRRYRHMRLAGAATLFRHPATYLKIHVKGVLRTLLDPGAFEYLKLFGLYPRSGGLLGVVVDRGIVGAMGVLLRERPLVFWSNLALGLVLAGYLLFAAVALFAKGLWRMPGVGAVLLTALYLLISSGGPQALGRFRHPVMPVVCLFAGFGISWVSLRLLGKKKPARASELAQGLGGVDT